jgi:hypothetical protein
MASEVAVQESAQLTLDRIDRHFFKMMEDGIERDREGLHVGYALKRIRDKKLYRETHATFEEYYKERWNFERRRVYQLIDGYNFSEKLKPLKGLWGGLKDYWKRSPKKVKKEFLAYINENPLEG